MVILQMSYGEIRMSRAILLFSNFQFLYNGLAPFTQTWPKLNGDIANSPFIFIFETANAMTLHKFDSGLGNASQTTDEVEENHLFIC